jgi:hypothetical protein
MDVPNRQRVPASTRVQELVMALLARAGPARLWTAGIGVTD